MELISQIPLFGGVISTFVSFLAVIGIVVFVHEYGHYIVGRWCGIYAETFSMGMGPVIWSRKDRHGTVWQVSAVPIGGYVKFLGDRNAASAPEDAEAIAQMSEIDQARSFPRAAVYKRALTVLAGPMANMLLSIVVFAGLILWQGTATEVPTVGQVMTLPDGNDSLREGDEILAVQGQNVSSFSEIYEIALNMEEPGNMGMLIRRDGQELLVSVPYLLPAAIYGVEPLSAADNAGLRTGDIILEANGEPLVAFHNLRKIVEASGDTPIPIKVWRNEQVVDLTVTPQLREFPDGNGGFEKRVMIGISGAFLIEPATETPGFLTALSLGARQVVRVLDSSLNALKHIILGNLSPSNLQGPLGIAQMSQSTAMQGLTTFLSFVAVVSIGIGMLNLFPVPMLDGGHLVFFLIEAVRGKPLGGKTIQISVSIGLAMVLLLMVFVTYNDIGRLIARLVG